MGTECILPAVGQLNQLAAMKLDQRFSAAHLPELAIRTAPVHPFADAPGKLAPGDAGFRLEGFGDLYHEFFTKSQIVYSNHAVYYTDGLTLCSVKNVSFLQLLGGGKFWRGPKGGCELLKEVDVW